MRIKRLKINLASAALSAVLSGNVGFVLSTTTYASDEATNNQEVQQMGDIESSILKASNSETDITNIDDEFIDYDDMNHDVNCMRYYDESNEYDYEDFDESDEDDYDDYDDDCMEDNVQPNDVINYDNMNYDTNHMYYDSELEQYVFDYDYDSSIEIDNLSNNVIDCNDIIYDNNSMSYDAELNENDFNYDYKVYNNDYIDENTQYNYINDDIIYTDDEQCEYWVNYNNDDYYYVDDEQCGYWVNNNDDDYVDNEQCGYWVNYNNDDYYYVDDEQCGYWVNNNDDDYVDNEQCEYWVNYNDDDYYYVDDEQCGYWANYDNNINNEELIVPENTIISGETVQQSSTQINEAPQTGDNSHTKKMSLALIGSAITGLGATILLKKEKGKVKKLTK